MDQQPLPGDDASMICKPLAEFQTEESPNPNPRARSGSKVCGKLKYVSPWEWTAKYNSDSRLAIVTPPVGSSIYFNTNEGNATAYPSGTSRKRHYRVQLLKADMVTPETSGKPAYMMLVDEDGTRMRFDTNTGMCVSMTSFSGKTITRADYEKNNIITRDAAGNLTAYYNATEGLMTTIANLDGSYGMAWFTPDKVQVVNGKPVGMGEPYKTVMYHVAQTENGKVTTITRQSAGRPAHVETRVENGRTVTITKGTGDDTIIRTIETHKLYGGMSERIETIRGINDAEPASCHRTLKMSTEGGWLVVEETEAFNTPLAHTTHYEYNEKFLVSRIDYPNGNYVEYEYDAEGRVTKETRPWGDGGKKMTRNVYAARSSRFYDNRPIKVYTDYEDTSGKFLNLAVTDYTYEDSAEVERTTATTFAAGVNHQHVTIDETYGEAAAYSYAIGKPKFSQAVNGVQTWHDYEATTEHGAVHKHTVTTKANGELVAAQSRKTEKFIAASETTTFEQEFIWDGENWLLLNTAAYEYDEEKRIIKTTRGNGRTTTTEWMCCGKLRETNEDGITTSYGYNSAQQLVETIRSEVKDGEVVVTPETITSYTYDATGRTLSVRRDIGAMTTTESTEYDTMGRETKQVDVLGRETTTEYSVDGLTTTTTTPAGATFITVTNPDGSTKEISGTGQRAQKYSYDINGKNIATTVRLMNNAILSQNIVNGFGQTVVQTSPATNNRFIYTRSEYNSKGQMIKQYRDTGWNTTSTAPTLYEYDAFGNVVKQTLALSDSPTKDDSPVIEMAYSVESMENGVYHVTIQTRYNAEGTALNSLQKQLISHLSSSLASKSISIDVRGNSNENWSAYSAPAKMTSYSSIPTSNITAEVVSVDGMPISEKDNVGIITSLAVQSFTAVVNDKTITTSMYRRYTATGLEVKQRDGRGNVTTTITDIAGRTISVTDAIGATTTTVYDISHDQPSVITDAMGNTSCYKYDLRGRKIAEWGTSQQPACFGYDDMNNMTSLRTFRVDDDFITTDPSDRSDYDETTWTFNAATGLEMSKSYADNTFVVKTYDAYNRLATKTDARGNVKTYSYELARGLYLGSSYTVVDGTAATTARSFSYNHLGQMTRMVDDAGVRCFGYNSYGEPETDSIDVDGDTHLIIETRDSFGRSAGYTYAKNGTVLQTVSTGYGDDGRIDSAGFTHGGKQKLFGYTYLAGSNLLQVLNKPNGMTLTQTYEATRDLLTSMAYHRGSTLVAQRTYTYDILGRPTARNTARQGTEVSDTFAYNTRAELMDAQVNGREYEYTYDNIGNRQSALEGNDATMYDTNELNQYTAISENDAAAFVPQFDADGNQTLSKTSTGIWASVYNAEKRPVSFTNEATRTVVECTYDSMGRRAFKKVTVNGTVTLHQRYIYRGYLQIACIDLTRSNHPALWFITWDPTQPVATRPLAIQKNGTWYSYGWDLTKNICEVYGQQGYIRSAYTYPPYGQVTATGDTEQSIQWSSEFNDSELGLFYFNYRYYNPNNGRWLGRDTIFDDLNTYRSLKNSPVMVLDVLGKWNDGLEGKGGNERNRGHSDFPGHGDPDYNFDYKRADHQYSTSPFNPLSTYLHFLPLATSEAMVVTAIEKCDAREFELAMHYMQDFFSHYGQGFKADKVTLPDPLPAQGISGDHELNETYLSYAAIDIILQVLGQTNKYGDFGHVLTSLNSDKQPRPIPVPDDAWTYKNAFEQAVVRSQHWYGEWKKHCKCKSQDNKVQYPNPRTMSKAAPPQEIPSVSPYEILQRYIEQKIEQDKALQQIIGNNLPNLIITL